MRPRATWCLRFLGAASVIALATTAHPRAARSQVPFGVLLTTVPEVTAVARASLIDEATRIWARAGVQLEWLPPGDPPPPAINSLRVLAVHRPPSGSADTFVLGELVRGAAHAVAMVSLGEARGITERLAPMEPRDREEQRLGMILGRAAAHEIGHYLLRTSTHAREGLMRPRITDREFADPRAGGFDLDASARAWLHARAEGGLDTTPPRGKVAQTAFNYLP